MANVASSNYTATNTRFSIPGDDGDRFNRILHVYSLATALEEHDHSDGRGLPVSTDQLLTITSTDTGASSQVTIFQGDSASPADNDEVYISYKTSNDAGEQTELGRFTWVATDVSDGTEDGRLDFAVMTAGTLADELQLDGAALSPSTSDGLAIGTSSLMFSDLFLASGSVINFNNGDVTLTHSSNLLTLAGGNFHLGTTNYLYLDADNDTHIRSPSDDVIEIYVGNTEWIDIGSTTDVVQFTRGIIYLGTDATIERGAADVIQFTRGEIWLGTDVKLQRGAANRLDLLTGDSFKIVDGTSYFNHTTTATSSETDVNAFVAAANPSGTSSHNLDTIQILAETTSGNSQNITGRVVGLINHSRHQGTGTLSYLEGVNITVNKENTGVVTSLTALKIDVNNSNSTNAITYAYGIYIEGFTATGAITNRYGIYQAGASETNYFAGKTDFIDDVKIKTDSKRLVLGTGEDATILYDGTNLVINPKAVGSGYVSFSGNLVIPNAGNIGSASDTDSIAISSSGVVTMNQIPVFSAGINVSGGTITGTLATAAQANVTSLGTLTALNVSGSTSLDGAVIINNSHADADTRIETDTNDSAFFVNAGSFSGVGSVGIGDDPMVGASTEYAAVLFDHPAITQAAGRNFSRFHVRTGSAVTIPSGTTSYVESVLIEEPNITATGTVTTASTLRIPSAPSEGTNNYALLVDAGNVRIDDSLLLGTTVGLSSGATDRLDLATGDVFNIVSGGIYIAATETSEYGVWTSTSARAKLKMRVTTANANGPQLFFETTGTPTGLSEVGTIQFQGMSDGPTSRTLGAIVSVTDTITDGDEDAHIRFYTMRGGDSSERVRISDGVHLKDNVSLYLGTGNDALIHYDSTNLVINPKVAGSGYTHFNGDVNVAGNISAGSDAGSRGLTLGGAAVTAFQIQVNALGSNGHVYMDWSVEGGDPDYDSRLYRAPTANGHLHIINRGSGVIYIQPNVGTGDFSSYFDPGQYSQVWTSGSAGAVGPYHHTYHNSASPDENDQLFYLRVDGEDSNSNQTVYGYNRWLIGSPTDGAEWVYVDWHLSNGAGITTQQMKLVGNYGRLELPITGSNAGILIGTDTQLYRGDTNWLYLASGDGFSIRNGRQYNIYYDTTTSGETDVNTLVSYVQPGGASSSTTDTLQTWTQTSTANNITGRVSGITQFVGHYGTGTLAYLQGELIDIRKQNTGPVTNATGVQIMISNDNATNVITNGYGLYINAFTATGAITNRYAIYQAGASETNYFAGPITANSGLTQNSTGVGMKVAAWSTSIGLGIQSSLLEFITDSVHADFRWGYGASGLLTEVMFLDSAVGRLALPSTDANSGILLGGDVQFFRGAANRLDLASGDSFNIVGGLLTVTGGYFGDAASTTAKLTTGNGTTSRVASLSFNSTFYSHADTGARRTADITAGYSTGAWGTEYLSFNVGGAGDSYNKTYEIVRITEGVTDGQGAFTVKPDNTASFTNPSGRWAALIQHPSNAPSRYGLSVCTTWASDENKVFEVARQWDGVSTNYYPMYYIDGVGTLTVKDAVAAQNTVLTIDSSGKMLIGGGNATAGNQTMDVYNKGTGATNYLMIFNDVNSQVGSISHNAGDVTAFSTASDYRLKENETAITNAITRVKGLKPYRFNFKQYPSNTLDGFFAHEVAAVVPEAVTGVKDEMKLDDDGEPTDVIQAQGVDSAKLVPLLTAALQEAIARIEALEARI